MRFDFFQELCSIALLVFWMSVLEEEIRVIQTFPFQFWHQGFSLVADKGEFVSSDIKPPYDAINRVDEEFQLLLGGFLVFCDSIFFIKNEQNIRRNRKNDGVAGLNFRAVFIRIGRTQSQRISSRSVSFKKSENIMLKTGVGMETKYIFVI